MVLNHDEGIASVDELVKQCNQSSRIGQVKSRCRLVEHINGRLMMTKRRKLCRKLQSLRFASRERVRALTELNVANSQLTQRLKRPDDLGMIGKVRDGFLGGKLKHITNRQPVKFDCQRRGFKPQSGAGLARSDDVGKE